MGFNGKYYDQFVAHTSDDCSNKISDLQGSTNKMDLNKIKDLIDKIQEQLMKEKKDASKVHLNSRNYEVPHVKLDPVEYVIEETKDEDENER